MFGRRPVRVAVRPGDVVRLPEHAYQYGAGTLVLRVTEVCYEESRPFGGDWLVLRGVELRAFGRDGDRVEVLALISALPGGPRNFS